MIRLDPTYDICVNQCGAKCCRSSFVKMDIVQMQRLKELKPEIEITQDLENINYWVLQFTEDCPFLKGNLCSIYEERPDGCRRYPVDYEERCLLWRKS